MRMLIAVSFLLLAAPALAQQQPAASVQDQLISTYSNINNGLAKQLDAANGYVASLQQQVTKLTVELKAMKDKYEPEKAKQEEKK